MTDARRARDVALFASEARSLLSGARRALAEWQDDPAEQDAAEEIFRALHTIKGSGAMFGFDQIAAFAHDVENAFDRVRAGRLAVSPELIGITLAGRDHIRVLLEGGGPEGGRAIVERLRTLVGTSPGADAKRCASGR